MATDNELLNEIKNLLLIIVSKDGFMKDQLREEQKSTIESFKVEVK